MMNNPTALAKLLIGAGTVILVSLGVWHLYAATHHQLGSFDDGGWRITLPFLGTICLAAGIFLLALSGGNKNR